MGASESPGYLTRWAGFVLFDRIDPTPAGPLV